MTWVKSYWTNEAVKMKHDLLVELINTKRLQILQSDIEYYQQDEGYKGWTRLD